MNPWDVLARQITRLNDRVDVLPAVREATVSALSPLEVTFDTDTVGTVVFGSVVSGLTAGQRVLTLRLARYVWVLGARNGGETAWVDLTSYLASGVTYTADGSAPLSGIKARRIGRNVELSLGNFTVDSMNVGVSGNVANAVILDGIPEQFRPSGGAAVSPAWNGRIWSGYVDEAGDVRFAAVVPNADQTGTETWADQTYSGTAFYPAA